MPTKKTPELIETVLSRIALGETMTSISRDLGFSPDAWALWMKADPTLATAYYDARSIGADAIADDVLSIADSAPLTPVDVAKARLRTDVRLKLLAKWQPDKYGDKVDVRHQGHDGGAVQVAYANVADIAAQMRAVLTGRAAPVDPAQLPAPSPVSGEDLL